MIKIIQYFKARLAERSTYMFVFASLGSAVALPQPFNWIGLGLLIVAAMVPDGPVS